MKKLVLVDGNSMIFKAYYATAAMGNLMVNSKGQPTNALQGMANMMLKIITEREPDHLMVAFDAGKKTLRHDSMTDYKAGRSATPDELKSQFVPVIEMLKCMGIKTYQLEGYEADDIIGTLARSGEKLGYDVEIFTSDKDMLQLIDDNTTVYLTKSGITNLEKMDIDALYAKWGISPCQVPDLKGLMGDASDNIPGIKGIGEKTAIKLLKEYGTIENLFLNTHKLKGALKSKVELGVKSGTLSKEIATIICDAPIEVSVEDSLFDFKPCKALANFLQHYELRSILKRLDIRDESDFEYTVVENFSIMMLDEFAAVSVEVYDDNYNKSFVIGYAVSSASGNYYISAANAKKDKAFKAWLANDDMKKITFNTAKLINASHWEGITVKGIVFDLQIAAYLVNHKLKMEIQSIADYFGAEYFVQSDDLIYGKGAKKSIPEIGELAQNATLKSRAIFDCYDAATNAMKDDNLTDLFESIEMPLAHVLAKMEVSGVCANMDVFDQIGQKCIDKLNTLESEIFELAEKKFNVASPKQLAEVLFDELGLEENKKRSTAADKLVKLIDRHPIVVPIMEHRKWSKLLTTYVNGVKEYIGKDNKIHSVFNQTLTQTGRLSSKYPNLQNISIRDDDQSEIRKAFVSRTGYKLLGADYSQIELRVLAHEAKAEHLIEAFKQNKDIHAITAADVLDKNIDDITKKDRRIAKAVNFGIIYGISEFGLSEQLLISPYQAKIIIEKYLRTYPAIDNYRNKVIDDATKNGYTTTIFNRKRYIPELVDKNFKMREFGKRAAMNAPIQGSAADIIKIAMIRVEEKIKELNLDANLILQIHDELVFEVKEEDIETVRKVIKNTMENAVKLDVPLVVDCSVGDNLHEAK